nr:hypothetical protein [Gemmatimonadales bacterium]
MTTERQETGERSQSTGMQEAHLKLSPVERVSLHADYVTKTGNDGKDQKTSTLGTALQLAPEAELFLVWRKTDATGGRESEESTARLKTDLGGGASTAKLAAERTVIQTDSAGLVEKLKCALAGSVGSGSGRINL